MAAKTGEKTERSLLFIRDGTKAEVGDKMIIIKSTGEKKWRKLGNTEAVCAIILLTLCGH